MPSSVEKLEVVEHASMGSGDFKKQGWLEHSEVEQKRVLRKMDLHLLPFISLLYLLSFL